MGSSDVGSRARDRGRSHMQLCHMQDTKCTTWRAQSPMPPHSCTHSAYRTSTAIMRRTVAHGPYARSLASKRPISIHSSLTVRDHVGLGCASAQRGWGLACMSSRARHRDAGAPQARGRRAARAPALQHVVECEVDAVPKGVLACEGTAPVAVHDVRGLLHCAALRARLGDQARKLVAACKGRGREGVLGATACVSLV